MTKLKELAERVNAFARKHLSEGHELMPMWHLQTGNGKNIVIGTPFDDLASKEAIGQKMREFFEKENVVRYVFVSEVWYKAIPKEFDINSYQNGDLASDSESKEAITTFGEDRETGETIFIQNQILRIGKKLILRDAKTSKGEKNAGRFANMFVTHTTTQ